MRLTIFSRLVLGYFVIFILAMAVSTYAIAQLRQLEDVTHSIITIENRLIDYKQKLTDSMLSMMRYEGKFIIIKDEVLYDHFIMTKGDFDKYFRELMTIADTPQLKNLLFKIQQSCQNYFSLFDEEVTYLKSGEPYPMDRYKEQKENATNEIMKDLKELESYSKENTYYKIKKLGEAEVTASKVAILMGLSSLLFGIVISIFITRSIAKPLSIMKKKTQEIARGNFEGDLNLSSPHEIRELAQAFNSMCIKLKEIDKMKSDFFSLMSHELRTPLTSIKEGTNLLREGSGGEEVTEKQKRLLKIITEECNRLIKMVNSLLDLSKMEAGMMVYNFTQADLTTLINRVTNEIEPLAETDNIKVEVSISKYLPLIKVDAERILQVLRNLIGNAVKFTPNSGYVRISASPVTKGVQVSIADTGVGIPKEKLTTIFNKFQQEALTSSNKIMGTGLGLSIVNNIIKAHGGKIWVESVLGRGSIFTFVLPA